MTVPTKPVKMYGKYILPLLSIVVVEHKNLYDLEEEWFYEYSLLVNTGIHYGAWLEGKFNNVFKAFSDQLSTPLSYVAILSFNTEEDMIMFLLQHG